VSLGVAIALHNIPEGVSVAMPVYFATKDKGKALKFTFISGISEPIGALLAFFVLRPFLNGFVIGASFALVAGIMLYISIEELIPSSRQYGHNRLALFSTFAGLVLMPLSHLI
jgi:ZIP family zinc transporter